MLRLSREADYGIVLMTRLARRRDDTVTTARDLAERARLSPQMVSKVMKQLTRARLVESQRGARGDSMDRRGRG